MSDFAKIFNSEEFGQILVRLDQDEGKAVVTISIRLPYPMDICSTGVAFMSDNPEIAIKHRQEFFDKLTAESVLQYARLVKDLAPRLDTQTGELHDTH